MKNNYALQHEKSGLDEFSASVKVKAPGWKRSMKKEKFNERGKRHGTM